MAGFSAGWHLIPYVGDRTERDDPGPWGTRVGELELARKVMDLRQTDLASMLEVTSGTVSLWENDAEPIPRQSQLSVLLFLERTARFGTPLPLDACNDNTLSPVRIVAA